MGHFGRCFVAVAAVVAVTGLPLGAQRGRTGTQSATPEPPPRPAPAPSVQKSDTSSPKVTIQQRNIALKRSQIDTLSKQLASVNTDGKNKSKFGLGSLLKGDEPREQAARQMLETEASQEAGKGRTAIVVIGNEGDVTKVRESLAVQRDVILLFVDDSLVDDTTDNAAVKGGLAAKVTGMATNMWVYLPSSGNAATRKPNQTLSTKVATAKLWSGIFASDGDLPAEAQNALNGTGPRGNPNEGKGSAAASAEPSTAAATKSTGAFAEGDVLGPKIAGVKLMVTPDDAGKLAATLTRSDEVVVIGQEKNGYVNVQGASAAGWVKIVLVQKR